MTNLNEANWAYHIESHDGIYKKNIGDLDSLRINYRQNKLKEGKKINQMMEDKYNHLVFLPLMGMTVNLNKENLLIHWIS